MFKKLYKKSSGFTLIELMVVIAIIAILAVLALAAFGEAQRRARDARRRADLKAYQAALEMNFDIVNTMYEPIDSDDFPNSPQCPVDPLDVGAQRYMSCVSAAGTCTPDDHLQGACTESLSLGGFRYYEIEVQLESGDTFSVASLQGVN